jgi:uncharacterized protein
MNVFILSALFSLGFFTQGAQALTIPQLTGPIVDEVGLLSRSTKEQLTHALQLARQKDGLQVQVFIVSSLQGVSIEELAIKVFDQWKLGDEKKDNGVLFLIAPNEKKLRIEVGRGLEGDIPDAIAKRIVADTVRPYFLRGEFSLGVVQGVSSILHYAQPDVDHATGQMGANESAAPEKSDSGSKWIFLVVFLLWVALFIFNPGLAIALLFRGASGGGRGGGGGWSGGGGSSAGGGASGSW